MPDSKDNCKDVLAGGAIRVVTAGSIETVIRPFLVTESCY